MEILSIKRYKYNVSYVGFVTIKLFTYTPRASVCLKNKGPKHHQYRLRRSQNVARFSPQIALLNGHVVPVHILAAAELQWVRPTLANCISGQSIVEMER